MLRAVILSVVSSAAQAEEDRYSLPEQIRMNTEAAERLGATVVATLAFQHSRWFTNVAALTSESPDYARLIELITSHSVDLLILTQMDRLGRTARLQLEMQDFCWERGVQLYAVTEPLGHPIDPSLFRRIGPSSGERQARSYQAIGAESYVRMFVQNSRRGLRGKALSGMHICKWQAPYGYMHNETPKLPLLPHPTEASVVQRIGAMRIEWAGYAAIAETMEREGYPTRSGAPWNKATIATILANPFYAGYVRYREWSSHASRRDRQVVKETLTRGLHTPLWDDATWRGIQEVKGSRARIFREAEERRADFLLSGLLRCAHCGGRMRYNSRVRNHVRGVSYVVCARYSESGGKECCCNSVQAPTIHTAVYETVSAALARPEAFIEEQAKLSHADEHSRALALLQAQLVELNKREANIVAAVEMGTFSLDLMVKRQEALTLERRTIERQVAAYQEQAARLAQAQTTLVTMADALAEFTPDNPVVFRRVCLGLIDSIAIDNTGPTIIITWRGSA